MDRNGLGFCHYRDDVSSLSARRAWIEITDDVSTGGKIKSLSARRAWIEIQPPKGSSCLPIVALRKESVDRNLFRLPKKNRPSVSLSARRAWIEMSSFQRAIDIERVALRKESVDRNFLGRRKRNLILSRSPQGERG